jgi:hypothetical protein
MAKYINGNIDFKIIAKTPISILTAGGILCILFGLFDWARFLIALVVLLELFKYKEVRTWLRKL